MTDSILSMKFGINSLDKMVSHWLMHSPTEIVKDVADADTWRKSNTFEAKVLVNGIELPFESFDKFMQDLYLQLCKETEEKYSNVEAEVQRRMEQRMKLEAEPLIDKMNNVLTALQDAEAFIKPYWDK